MNLSRFGVPHWEITYTPLRDAAGTIVGAFHHAQDISGRLRAESELQTAQEALRQAQSPDRYDVAFSDVVMPGMNGVELGREIRRLHPGLPVVLTGGYSHVLAKESDHGFELLQKPYLVEALSRVLRKAASRRRRGRAAAE